MNSGRVTIATVLLALGVWAWGQNGDDAGLGKTLAAVQEHARKAGDALFPGYSKAPFGFLLEAKGHETLLCYSHHVDGFSDEGVDPATKCSKQVREGQHMPDNLLAAMGVFGPEQVIVMGTPESTGRSREAWVRTIYHEHFHQYEGNLPKFYERADALGLNHDDKASWMLMYPFPYDSKRVQGAYKVAANALASAVDARGTRTFCERVREYKKARAAFAATVLERDWRYLDFEMWYEGTARWAEFMIGKSDPDAAVQKVSVDLERKIPEQLRSDELGERKREVVYAMGAGEAMLMEAEGGAWMKKFPEVMGMSPLLEEFACKGK